MNTQQFSTTLTDVIQIGRVTMIAAMDGSARLAALGTPTDLSVQINLDREVGGALLDAATDAALGNGERDGHASHDGKLSLTRHRPESIGRHPRKVSKNPNRGNLNPRWRKCRTPGGP